MSQCSARGRSVVSRGDDAEEGRLSLDDPVTRHLPDLAHLPRQLSVRQLLNNTSAIREIFTIHEHQPGIENLAGGARELLAIVRSA